MSGEAAAETSGSTLLPSEPHTVRRARRFVAACCEVAGLDEDLVETVRLLSSELVTNAVVHGRGRVRLWVEISPAEVLVEVGDEHPHRPRLGDLATDGIGGRGVALIDVVASDWGVREELAGKAVWFSITRSSPTT